MQCRRNLMKRQDIDTASPWASSGRRGTLTVGGIPPYPPRWWRAPYRRLPSGRRRYGRARKHQDPLVEQRAAVPSWAGLDRSLTAGGSRGMWAARSPTCPG